MKHFATALVFLLLWCPLLPAQELIFGPGSKPGVEKPDSYWQEVERKQSQWRSEQARKGIPDSRIQFDGETEWHADPSAKWREEYRQHHGREWQPSINRDMTQPDEALRLRALVDDLRRQIEVLTERLKALDRDKP